MRTQDIKIGEYYRHRTSPSYAYAKAIKVLKPIKSKYRRRYTYDRSEVEKNILCTVVKCEGTIYKNNPTCLIKYFRPCDLIKDKDNE